MFTLLRRNNPAQCVLFFEDEPSIRIPSSALRAMFLRPFGAYWVERSRIRSLVHREGGRIAANEVISPLHAGKGYGYGVRKVHDKGACPLVNSRDLAIDRAPFRFISDFVYALKMGGRVEMKRYFTG